jgi:hypothetical protein
MYKIIQATGRRLFMYIRQFGALPFHRVSWKRERGSSSRDLHPILVSMPRRPGLKGNPLRVLRPAEYEGAAKENWESCVFGW